MSMTMECRKLKRTGFFPAVLGVGLLSAMVPVVNTAVRPQLFLGRDEPPLHILMGANWQMIAMMNVFLIILAACVMYHTEFADNAIQKMDTLPLHFGSIFVKKSLILAASSAVIILQEAAGFAVCVYHWFGLPDGFFMELAKTAGYEWLLSLPVIVLMLALASVCRNMWVSLGIGVVGLFAVIAVPQDMLAVLRLDMFPFALPFQMFSGAGNPDGLRLLFAAGAEILVFAGAEAVWLRVRRDAA